MEHKFKNYIYSHVYSTIKERAAGKRIIETSVLKDILMRHYFCNEMRGGNRKGIPKKYMYGVINDLQALGMIKRVNHSYYEILKSDCEKCLVEPFPF